MKLDIISEIFSSLSDFADNAWENRWMAYFLIGITLFMIFIIWRTRS